MRIYELARLAARLAGARFRNERGATAVEYGLMVALIASVIITSVVFLGATTSSSFDCIGRSLPRGVKAC